MHIVDDVPELDGRAALTMVLSLDGFLDAGNAAARPSSTSRTLSDGPVVATFDVDELHDYRARRPPMSFVRDHYEAYDAPGWSSGCCATPAGRRTCCCTGRSRTTAGRRSPARCARWWSASA